MEVSIVRGLNQCLTEAHIHSDAISSHPPKISKLTFAATWMELEMIILSEVSQKEKDKYHMISLICGI